MRYLIYWLHVEMIIFPFLILLDSVKLYIWLIVFLSGGAILGDDLQGYF